MAGVTPLPRRIQGEPAMWYRRFCAWLRSGPPRSVLAVANAERAQSGRKKADEAPGSWDGKPDLYRWKERAAEWDLAEAERLNVELAEQREAWRKSEMEAARALQAKGLEGLKIPMVTARLKDGSEIIGQPQAVRVAAECLTKASDLARRALEMTNTRVNLQQLSDADLLRLVAFTEGEQLTGPAAG